MPNFRAAVLADVEHIVALVNSAYRGENSRVGWTTEADLLEGQRTDVAEVTSLIARSDSLILLYFNDDEIIGSLHLHHDQQAVYLGMLVVRPSLQGMGVGKLFMQKAEETAAKMWGVVKMRMYVITLRHELIAFYERRGYHRTGTFKEFPQDIKFGIPKVSGLQIELLEKN